MHTTVEQILNDDNFAAKMLLPKFNCECYMIYKGGRNIEYYFFYKGNILFSGDDFKTSLLYDIDGIESMIDLLGFITVQRGDVGLDYFSNYTDEQIEWTESHECEELQLHLGDYQYTDSENTEAHTEAIELFNSAYSQEVN